jgi:hypothetical protein
VRQLPQEWPHAWLLWTEPACEGKAWDTPSKHTAPTQQTPHACLTASSRQATTCHDSCDHSSARMQDATVLPALGSCSTCCCLGSQTFLNNYAVNTPRCVRAQPNSFLARLLTNNQTAMPHTAECTADYCMHTRYSCNRCPAVCGHDSDHLQFGQFVSE